MNGESKLSWKVTLAPELFELGEIATYSWIFRAGMDISRNEFPQEGGLEKLAVDFDKGMLPGPGSHGSYPRHGKSEEKSFGREGTGTLSSELPVHFGMITKKWET